MSEWIKAPAEGNGMIPVRGLDDEIVGHVARWRRLDDGTVETEMAIDADYADQVMPLFPNRVSIGPFPSVDGRSSFAVPGSRDG